MKQSRSAAIHSSLAIALFVMVAFAFSSVLSDEFRTMNKHYNNLIIDFAGGLFIFLCGMHEMQFMKKGVKSGKFTSYCQNKGILFLVAGFALAIYFPVHALCTLGVLYFLTPQIIKLSSGVMVLLAAIILIVAFKFYTITGWPWPVAYVPKIASGNFIGKSIIYGIFRSYYGIFPWAAYYIIGLLFGKITFTKKKVVRRTVSWSIGLILAVLIIDPQISKFFWIKPGDARIPDLVVTYWPFGWNQHGALFAVMGICLCVLWITGVTLLMERIGDAPPVKILTRVGRMKFTFYGAAVIIGAGLILAGDFDVIDKEIVARPEFIAALSFFFIMGCFVFTTIWRRWRTHGPLEKIMMKLGGLHVG